jgi:hypothetical protein
VQRIRSLGSWWRWMDLGFGSRQFGVSKHAIYAGRSKYGGNPSNLIVNFSYH